MVMAKVLVVTAAVSIASPDVLSHDDDALSLLQTRVQKHVVNQEPTLFDGSVLRVGAKGSTCADDEDITFAKCAEAQKRQVIPNQDLGHSAVSTKRNLFGDGVLPRGCFLFQNNFFFNDQPVGNANVNTEPVCQVGGGGGFAADVAAWGISCPTGKEDCKYRGYHQMVWDDSLFVPELKLGAKGSVCEEACGLLTWEQCAKSADMGLINELTPGFKTREQPNHQIFGAVHTLGTLPSGCSVTTGGGIALVYWNSHDTAIGAHEAPNTDGDPLVTPSGVGSGWFQVAPVCGVCTTTTTTPEVVEDPDIDESENDEASAIADPHVKTNTNHHFDLSDA